ncbi:hypothetical protein MFLO_12576 [Listeria floridensis FSL S10-1187]|uniref:DUF3006 domain-containing protein n=1 Tax=Listeria floridensis FSL S10-1187 TaxID=1265817 RepID=A0ABN0RCT8_9LIST|nr:DUF3006 domain-containing protein [Listeria floridensis]EUJ28001.1 hypothetical protein MFLO_12576 [Listeria floridensis FSL S10-1187]
MEIKATIDRIEDGIAVFITETDERTLEFPVELLADDLAEGDAVLLSLEVKKDAERGEERKERIADKLKRLREQNGE